MRKRRIGLYSPVTICPSMNRKMRQVPSLIRGLFPRRLSQGHRPAVNQDGLPGYEARGVGGKEYRETCYLGGLGNATERYPGQCLSLIHISEPTRLGMISYAVFCLN